MSRENELGAIVALLGMLAEQCGEKASDNRLAFVASEIAQHGTQRCVDTLKNLMRSARRFPTVAEIEKEMGVGAASVDTEAIGREIADKIYTGIKKFGSRKNRRPDVEELLGPVGLEVVRQLGGWEHLCETTLEVNIPTLKAQWRESAIGVAERIKRGDLNAVPGAALAAIPQKPGLNAIDIDSMTRMIGGPPYE